jgi:hypothetical protein
MKVITETPTVLILKENSISQIFSGVIFIIIGIAIIPLLINKGVVYLLFSLGFILFGLAFILLTKFVTITINKSVNKVNFIFTNLLGKTSQDIAIDQISEIAIQENLTRTVSSGTVNSSAYQNTSPKLSFVLIFYLKDGQGIPISMGSSNGSLSLNGIPLNIFSGRNKRIEIGNKIASFIGVPFRDNRPPTISDMTNIIGQAIENKEMNVTSNPQPPTVQS